MIKLVVKTLKVGDVEDPEIYLGAVAHDWLCTEHGKYVKEKATDLTYNQMPPGAEFYYGYQYAITALFEDEEAVIYKLKWGDVK
jgi:hypothetical protein